MKKPCKYRGREADYRVEYRIEHREERKAYDKKYNRIYYLKHKGRNVKNPKIPRG